MQDLDTCAVHQLGTLDYQLAWKLQDSMAAEIASGKRLPSLLLLEHPHTYTFGRRGNLENLVWDEADLARRGVAVYWVDRGGDVTYHGPGQLVGYPLLPLGRPQLSAGETTQLPQADYIGYIRKLEQALIQALNLLGVQSVQVPGLTGVWISDNQSNLTKIAAIGVKVDAHGVTRHGFALNIATDPLYWQGIIGCGLKGYGICNLGDYIPDIKHPAVITAVISSFGEIFKYEMVEGLTLVEKLSTL